MSRYLDVMRRLSKNSVLRATMARIQAPLDMRFKDTRFAISKLGAPDVPLCYLTTTGRKSGEPRVVPLTYMDMGVEYAVVASNYGRDNHPAWSYNLEANAKAILEIDGISRDVLARPATECKMKTIWERFDDFWPGYEEYRRIAPRTFRVFLLEPVAATAPSGGTGERS